MEQKVNKPLKGRWTLTLGVKLSSPRPHPPDFPALPLHVPSLPRYFSPGRHLTGSTLDLGLSVGGGR